MITSYKRLPNAGEIFPVYLEKRHFVMLNAVLKTKYFLLNVSVMNYAAIGSTLVTHMFASAL
jgi:hypothetical protein